MRGNRQCTFAATSTRVNDAINTAEMKMIDDTRNGGGTASGLQAFRAWRLGVMAGSCLSAADEAAATEPLEEVIVTGTAGGAELRKQDASFTITTVTADQIEAAAPKSSAELLTQLPGVWVESSGGVSGANINVIGFPEAGDAPHVTFEINGAPIFGTESLSFMEQSTLFRVDETINSVEGVIGGPGSVFAKGEPGLTTNFRLKEGGEQTKGVVKYTGSDYNLQRVDAEVSGKLSDDLYYMVGGYVSASPGIRNAQFLSEKGHQFTVNLTKKLEHGKIGLWTRVTDDVGQWLLPFFSKSGNNLGTFSQLGDFTRMRQIQVGKDSNGDAVYENFDFANGRGWRGSVSGLNAEFNTSDNTVLRDNLSFTSGNADTYGFVPDGGAVQVSALVGVAPGAVTTQHGGKVLAQSDWVQEYGYWVVKKQIRSFTNDISLAIKTASNNDLTVGYYVAQWSVDDWWSLNNQAPVQNIAHGDLLSANVTCALLAASGSGAGCWNYGLASTGDSTAKAFYLADSFHLTDKWRLDGGVRQERQTLDYSASFPAAGTTDHFPSGIVDQVVPDANASKFSYTAAADYEFSNEMGAFGRYTSGWAFPNFDSFRGGNGSATIQEIKEFEAGYKYTGPVWKAYTTFFWNTSDATAGVQGSNPGSAPQAFKSKAYGAVLDGSYHTGPFAVGVNATWQHAVYDTVQGTPSQVGKKVLRQPDLRVMLTPSYNLLAGDWSADFYGSIDYIGTRAADAANTFFFDAYTTIDAGVRVSTPWHYDLQLSGQNLTDRHDATEGDPRSFVAANYRPILGRSIQFSVSYKL